MAFSNITRNHPFVVELPFTVQTFDLDSSSWASEFAYLRWFASLRQQFLDNLQPQAQAADALAYSQPVLLSSQIEYRQPAQLADRLLGRLWLANLGKTRWTLQISLTSDRGVVAAATQVGHWLNPADLTACAIPTALLEQYWQYQWRS